MFDEINIQVGINPLTWSNDDCPELGDDIPLEQCLHEAHLAGYAGIELGRKFPRDAHLLRPLLAKHDLSLISGWYSANLLQRPVKAEIQALTAHVELLKAMGCKVLIFAETSGCVHGKDNRPLSERPILNEADWPIFCQKLNELASWVEDQGLSLAYHHHMGTVIENQGEILRLMHATNDAVGLLLDTGHLSYAGGQSLNIIEQYHHRIKHVHCKDTRNDIRQQAIRNDLPFLQAVKQGIFTVPGDGELRFDKIIEALIHHQYQGWLVVEAEQDPRLAHPLTYATKGFTTLKNILDQVAEPLMC